MRECLGWLSNCQEDACPQNWLVYAASELPATVSCHKCGQSVGLVTEEAEVEAAAGRAAFPVVPCTSMGGEPRDGIVSEPSIPQNGAFAPTPDLPELVDAPDTSWVCVLQNGQEVVVDRDNMVVGRSRGCDIILPSAKVSRQHATLRLEGSQLKIEDMGSANGVWRNGERVSSTVIQDGDVFTLSDEQITFRLDL